MTWFEAEESEKYVCELETALDDWKYDNARLRTELTELVRVENRFKFEFRRSQSDKDFRNLADDILLRVKRCRHEIRERLMA